MICTCNRDHVNDDEHAPTCAVVLSAELAQLRAQIAEATKLLQHHTDEAACAAARCGCVGETLAELVGGIVEEHAVLAREVEAWRTFANAAEDSSWSSAWADEHENVIIAEVATDASGALERARGKE